MCKIGCVNYAHFPKSGHNYALKLPISYTIEECSKIKPIMLKIMLKNLNYIAMSYEKEIIFEVSLAR